MAYYTGLISNTGIPDGTEITNIGADTLYNLPSLPGVYRYAGTSQPGLIDFKYASTDEEDEDTVKQNIIAELSKLQLPGVTTTPSEVEWVAFKAHVPFFEHVTAEQIRGGFYTRANALQGHRGVWYTGAAWDAADSGMIWRYTDVILQGVVKD